MDDRDRRILVPHNRSHLEGENGQRRSNLVGDINIDL